jgi:hypothetical protein
MASREAAGVLTGPQEEIVGLRKDQELLFSDHRQLIVLRAGNKGYTRYTIHFRAVPAFGGYVVKL